MLRDALSEATSRLFLVVGATSTGAAAVVKTTEAKTEELISSIPPEVIEAIYRAAETGPSTANWAAYASMASIVGVASMVLRFMFEMWHKMRYESPPRRREDDEN